MNASDLMHGKDYAYQDVTGWLISEKLNGCRAYWDGVQMWSRSGKKIAIPKEMRLALPLVPLDGEIHAGRGGFEKARRAVQYAQWCDDIRFSAFDAPTDLKTLFQDRVRFLSEILPLYGVASFVVHSRFSGIEEAVAVMRLVQDNGGEGVMLRDPAGLYVAGRSDAVLKLKYWPEAL